jgi:TP53 regulating kinase-like protein
MGMVGRELAKMHLADIVHGDLTTSNLMLRRPGGASPATLVRDWCGHRHGTNRVGQFLIDFGLAFTSALAEDKAVDLYVLERAFGSTHPESGTLFARVLEAYGAGLGRQWAGVLKKLEEVRLRGRKRSMVG